MFFFKRKKLIEIDEKIERLMQAVEIQSHAFHKIKQRLDMLEQELQRNAESIDHIPEMIMDLNMDNRQYICSHIDEKSGQMLSNDEKRFINIKNILQEQEKNRTILAEGIADEIKKFRDSYKDSETEMRKSINSIIELMDVNMEMENSEDGKLDVIENEIRLLLLNSVMEQIPE